MKDTERDLFFISPVKRYAPPEYPTCAEAKSDPALLKKVPSKWKKSMRAVACAGLLGVAAFSGAAFSCEFPHFGGAGGPPMYVVHLTEQEALNVIRTKAEYKGFNLDAEPPGYTVQVGGWLDVGLDLFDEEKGVAFSFINRWSRWGGGWWLADEAREMFEHQDNDITVGVFYDEGRFYDWRGPDEETRAAIKIELEETLSAQVREFIEWLQADGII